MRVSTFLLALLLAGGRAAAQSPTEVQGPSTPSPGGITVTDPVPGTPSITDPAVPPTPSPPVVSPPVVSPPVVSDPVVSPPVVSPPVVSPPATPPADGPEVQFAGPDWPYPGEFVPPWVPADVERDADIVELLYLANRDPELCRQQADAIERRQPGFRRRGEYPPNVQGISKRSLLGGGLCLPPWQVRRWFPS